eukprot:Skav210691  [mRNA]  locus=scaffold346:149724:159460:+ [translate_table: standard]
MGLGPDLRYDLHGVAEEPLAEEHVVVKCEAREKTSHVFQVEGRGSGDYELVFQPLQAGQVTGLRGGVDDFAPEAPAASHPDLRGETGEFWYDLSLLAEAAPAEEIAPLETAQTTVHIDNPTGQEAQGLGLPPLEARHVSVAAQVQIGPLATTQIPFSFCPPTMTQHTAEIALSVMKPNLSWSYRIQGVAEAPADPTLHTFTVQARESLQTTYALTLIGLDTTPCDRHGDQLSCQLEVPPQHQAMASRSRGKSDGQVYLKAPVGLDDRSPVNFSPLRPFVALCNLVITRASGGRWRFDLKLEATEPEARHG